jgi:hypothetical protein
MKTHWNYRPDLRACELEDRLLPAIPGQGAIVLTTGGDVLLLSPFPVIASDPFADSGGPEFVTPSVMAGSGVGYGLPPGSNTGVSGLTATAPTGSNGGAAVTIIVGSGADEAGAASIPTVTHNTIANDALSAAPVIGRVSGDRSAVLPPEQVYRGGLPVTATVGFSLEAPGQGTPQEPAQGPVDPLPLRLRRRPHRLASGAAGSLIRSHVDGAP